MSQEIFRVYGTVAIREEGDIERRMSDIGDSAEDAGGAFNDLIGTFDEVGAAAGGLAAIVGALLLATLKESIEFADKWDNAMGELAFDTNSTAEEIQNLDRSLEDLYKKGYGESIEDLARAMSEVKRQTGATNEELEKQVENTVMLSNKLESDYGETIRTVDNMVRIFGITHQEAFDLIAKGYQENLNVGGDLLDLFNEYSVNFKEIGMDEQDMLSILVEGREQGIYNYDLLLDGVREYGIKINEILEDEEAASEVFKALGLSVAEVSQAYRDGGDAAKNMNEKVWEALEEIKDPIEKNRLGALLIGSAWEDTSGKVATSMLGIRKEVKDTEGTMDDLIETKTDTLSEEWEKFRRDFEIKKMKPIGKLLENLALDIFNFFNDSNKSIEDGMDKSQAIIDGWSKSATKKYDDFKKKSSAIISSWKKSFINYFNDTTETVVSDISNMAGDIETIIGWIQGFIDNLIGGFGDISSAVSNVINKIGNISFPSIPGWIPGFAEGTRNFVGGLAVVGEKGKELVYLPPGSDVYSNEESKGMLNAASTYNEVMPSQKVENYNINKIIIDPQNIDDLMGFMEIVRNFSNNKLAYEG